MAKGEKMMFPLNNLRISQKVASLIIVSIFIFLVSCGENSTNKAKEFMAANMYEQAIALLEQEIQKNPKNADAHLLLGECKLVTGRLSEAQGSFKSATVLKPDLGMKIGEVAISAAKTALREQKHNQGMQIMSLAKKYDPKISKIISEICIDKAQKLFGTNMISEGMLFLKYSLSQDSSKKIEISNSLLNLIAKEAKGATGSNLNDIISWCIQLDQSKSKEIGKIYFDIGSTTLESSSQSAGDSIKKGFSFAVKYDSSLSSSAANKLYSFAKNSSQLSAGVVAVYTAGVYDTKIAKNSSDLLIDFAQKAYEQEQFKIFDNAIVKARKLTPNLFENASDRVRCLEALRAYKNGNRVQAIKEFKNLRKSSNSFAQNVSLKILAPPTVGMHKVGKSVQWKDLGYSGPMKIVLNSYEVTEQKEMILNLTYINLSDKKNELRYGTKNKKKWQPYIVDDNGKKFAPLSNFRGGTQKPYGSTPRYVYIYFNPNESAELSVTLPLPSEGASKFKLVSPRLNGWQWEWSINDINLR